MSDAEELLNEYYGGEPEEEGPSEIETLPPPDDPSRNATISATQAAPIAKKAAVTTDTDGLTLAEADEVYSGEGIALKDGATLEEAEQFYAMQSIGGRESAKLRKELDKRDTVDIFSAANTLDAREEYFRRNHGWLDTAAYYAGIPQQALTRQVVNALENLDFMTTEEAKSLLSRDELLPSDLVSFYMNDPSGKSPKWPQFMVGLAADVVLDPLNALTFGLSSAAKTAVVGARRFKDLSKLSTTERKFVKAAEAVDKIIKADGSIENVADHSKSLEDLVDMRLSGEKVGFGDFIINTGAKPKTRLELRKAVADTMTDKGLGKELLAGEREVSLAVRIPFTNIGHELILPKTASKSAGAAIASVPYLYDQLRNSVMMSETGSNLWKNFAPETVLTKTGKHLVDDQQMTYVNKMVERKEFFHGFEKKHRDALDKIRNNLGDEVRYDQLLKDINDELELRLYSVDEFLKSSDKPIKSIKDLRGAEKKRFMELVVGDSADAAREARLAAHPDAVRIVDEYMDINKELIGKVMERGLPFDPLKYSGPGTSRRYLQHAFTDRFFKYLDEAKEAGDDMGDALDWVSKNVGGVSGSEKGRRYRGTAGMANKISQEKLGFKIFVDDPLELITRRSLQMERIIQSHDLLEAASAYAVKGDLPGPGWVKFEPDKFGRYVMEVEHELESGVQLGKLDAWKNYLPSFYHTADKQSIYLPYDVYDRLLYQVNGHNLDTAVMSMIKGIDPLMNIFRNQALMGPAYLTTNALGNLAQHLTNNGLSGIRGIKNAAKLMFTGQGEFIVKNLDGKDVLIKGEQMLKEAIEDGAFNSGISGEFKFAPLAEQVASNREIVKSKTEKLKTVADWAFFWRFNRFVAEKSDQLPKVATYLERRQQGFSRAAAAELADRYFYTFNVGSRNQDIVSRAIPFSKFPIKTMEYVMSEIRQGNLANLVVPGKVRNLFEGAYVEDPDVRLALDSALPAYSQIKQPILGDLIPGAREVLHEMPWAALTMDMLFNPQESMNPAMKLFAGAMSVYRDYHEDDLYSDITQDSFIKDLKQISSMALPWYVKEYLTVEDIKHGTFGGYFSEGFAPEIPDAKDYNKSATFYTDRSPKVIRFENAVKFGDEMASSWLYKFYFGDDSEPLGQAGDKEVAAKGEYIRRKFRSWSLGTAQISKLDQNVLFNLLAIKRRITRETNKLKTKLKDNELLVGADEITADKYLKNMQDMHPEAKEILALKEKRQALTEIYSFILSGQQKAPNEDFIGTVFGVDTVKMNMADKPMVYDNLTRKAHEIHSDKAEDFLHKVISGQDMPASQVANPYDDTGMEESQGSENQGEADESQPVSDDLLIEMLNDYYEQ